MTLRLRREITVWQRLDHENVIPLLGTIEDEQPCIGMVSPWMEAGNLSAFVSRLSPTLVHRLQLVRELQIQINNMLMLHKAL